MSTDIHNAVAHALRTWKGSERELAEQLGTTRYVVRTVRQALNKETPRTAGRPLPSGPEYEVLSADAAQRALGIGRELFWRWIDTRVLATTRMSRQRVGVRWSELAALVRDRHVWTALHAESMEDLALADVLRKAQAAAAPFRWWSMDDLGDHHGYSAAAVRYWKAHHGYGAPGEWGIAPGGGVYLWCDEPPPPPVKTLNAAQQTKNAHSLARRAQIQQAHRERQRQRVVAAIRKHGMPRVGGMSKATRRPTWAEILDEVGLSQAQARKYLREAQRRGEL